MEAASGTHAHKAADKGKRSGGGRGKGKNKPQTSQNKSKSAEKEEEQVQHVAGSPLSFKSVEGILAGHSDVAPSPSPMGSPVVVNEKQVAGSRAWSTGTEGIPIGHSDAAPAPPPTGRSVAVNEKQEMPPAARGALRLSIELPGAAVARRGGGVAAGQGQLEVLRDVARRSQVNGDAASSTSDKVLVHCSANVADAVSRYQCDTGFSGEGAWKLDYLKGFVRHYQADVNPVVGPRPP